LRHDRAGLVGLVLLILWLAVAFPGRLLVTADANAQELADALLPPFGAHVLGTDHLGRDLLARLVAGATTSLVVSVSAVAIATVVGSVAGIAAAEVGGWLDEAIMRVADIQLAIPFVLLAIAVLTLLGGSLTNLIAVLALGGWIVFARVVRSELLALRELEFVQAARALGANAVHIAVRHLLPNSLGLIIVLATLELANVILLESALSFLGVGVQPPGVSWGTILAGGRDHLTSAWWISAWPGIAITLAILGVNLLGDFLRDLLEPRTITRD
jgi:peptide/nickel transport system permease protein